MKKIKKEKEIVMLIVILSKTVINKYKKIYYKKKLK